MCSLAALSPASVRVCSLAALSPASVKGASQDELCVNKRALQGIAALTSPLAMCRHLFVVLETSIRYSTVFEEAKTCPTSS